MSTYHFKGVTGGKDAQYSNAQMSAIKNKLKEVNVKLSSSQLSIMKQLSGLKGSVSDNAIIKAFITYSLNNLR